MYWPGQPAEYTASHLLCQEPQATGHGPQDFAWNTFSQDLKLPSRVLFPDSREIFHSLGSAEGCSLHPNAHLCWQRGHGPGPGKQGLTPWLGTETNIAQLD